MPPAKSEPTVLGTLLRGMQVLEYIAENSEGVLAKTLAKDLGLKPGTCYHLLRTLSSVGYVTRLPSGRFALGPQGASLARRMQLAAGPSPQISALLTGLHTMTNETAYVCGWIDGTIVLQQFLTAQPAGDQTGGLDVGYTGNMHARASCKSILAFLPDHHVETILDGIELVPLTQHTTAEFETLMAELRRIRRRGYAFDREEFIKGLACVSAPFFDASGMPAGSFSISVPIDRFAATASTLTDAIQQTASRATRQLQHACPAPTTRSAAPVSSGRVAARRA